MSLIMGIDTGGTFTDTVIWDAEHKKVIAKSKVFTTGTDLSVGIKSGISALNFDDFQLIEQVNISTTLTVNSILENRIDKVAVLVIGKHVLGKLPAHRKYEIVKDNYNKKRGIYRMPPEEMKGICQYLGNESKYILVSAFGEDSISTEDQVAGILRNYFDCYILCRHCMSTKENFYESTLDAITTAALRNVVQHWYESVRKNLDKFGIGENVRVLTGSGKLSTAEEVIQNPLLTLMSGPIASFIGSRYLTNEPDYLLVDMGGTSFDIMKVQNRETRFASTATDIGGYRYGIEMLDIQSFAVGGDSKIRYNSMGEFIVEPQRVTPLCLLGDSYPHLLEELQEYNSLYSGDLLTASFTDCFFRAKVKPSEGKLLETGKKFLQIIEEQPHSLFCLAEKVGVQPDALHVDQLIEKGYIYCASLTPTDIIHAEGISGRWNRDISTVAVKIMAEMKGWDVDTFVAEVKKRIAEKMAYCCMQSIAHFEDKCFTFEDSTAARFIMDSFLKPGKDLIGTNFSIRKPIVGVGAPAGMWLPRVAEMLDARLVLPRDGDVAGAVGAAASGKEVHG